MTNVKSDKRLLDINKKISELNKNVSDIKETISKKAAELKQLAKSKKEFKLSKTLGDLSHQLFLKEEKTLMGKAEILTHEMHELESDLKSAMSAISSLEDKINPLMEELKDEAISKNDISISSLRTEIAEILKSLFPKVEKMIALILDNLSLREGRGFYFIEAEKFVFNGWLRYALFYAKKLLTIGYDFGEDESIAVDLGIDDLRHSPYFYGADLEKGTLSRTGTPRLGPLGSMGVNSAEPPILSPGNSNKVVMTSLPNKSEGEERGGTKELRKAREHYS